MSLNKMRIKQGYFNIIWFLTLIVVVAVYLFKTESFYEAVRMLSFVFFSLLIPKIWFLNIAKKLDLDRDDYDIVIRENLKKAFTRKKVINAVIFLFLIVPILCVWLRIVFHSVTIGEVVFAITFIMAEVYLLWGK